MRGFGRIFGTAIAGLMLLASQSAEALTIRVSQESAAGVGDFDANVLGTVDSFSTGLSASGFFQYGSPNASSYNGETNGGPTPIANVVQSFFVETSDGLTFTTVMSAANAGGSGNWNMHMDLTGDAAGLLVSDDTGEGPTVTGGGTVFNSNHNWVACCTDGFTIGALDGTGWTLIADVNSFSGVTAWLTTDNGSGTITLALATDRRVRFDVIDVPAPATLALFGFGLAALARRRLS
jgi:hypothetical protein